MPVEFVDFVRAYSKPRAKAGLSALQKWIKEHFDDIAQLRSEGFKWEDIAEGVKAATDLSCTASTVRQYFSEFRNAK